jgi:hypothetical protein
MSVATDITMPRQPEEWTTGDFTHISSDNVELRIQSF